MKVDFNNCKLVSLATPSPEADKVVNETIYKIKNGLITLKGIDKETQRKNWEEETEEDFYEPDIF